jgi:sulfhydrogenase subunit beta (sulfur reductase)
MDEKRITNEKLQTLVSDFLKQGYVVMAESPDGNGFAAVKEGQEIRIDAASPPGRVSFKQAVFPKTEPVFYFRKETDDVRLAEAPAERPTTVILGAKPCDAKSIQALSKVFNWDYRDDFFNERAEKTVVIGMACRYSDEFCFCTSVGLSPTGEQGSDVFLVPLEDGSFAVRAVTPKGEEFLRPFLHFLDAGDPAASRRATDAVTGPKQKFDSAIVREWLGKNFEHPYWETVGQTCLGCAQCAFVCPTCHCFDIVDEESSYIEGRRMKNWDACQFGLFTKHASGHNPRANQGVRYRQRLSHKFRYYPERFGEILCTGCGRCSRGCAVGIDIGAIAETIGQMQ